MTLEGVDFILGKSLNCRNGVEKMKEAQIEKNIEKMTIREVIKEDLPQIKNLFLEAHKYASGFDEEIVVNERTTQEIEKQTDKIFKESNGKLFVAEEKDKIVGFVYATFSPGILKSGWISEIFVAETFRQKGIGSQLIEKGIDWLKQKGAKRVELTAYKINHKALSFYKKHQFKKQPAKFIRLGKEIKLPYPITLII